MRYTHLVIFVIVLLTVSQLATAENWPQWRGPRGDGVSLETGLPAEFGPDKNVAWKTPLPGQAGATPIVWEDRLFLTSVDGEDLLLMCFDTADGKELWRRKVGVGALPTRGDEGNSASPSPVTDGEHVWCFFGNGSLACYDFQGNQVWSMDVQQRYGKFDVWFVFSPTPVLYGEKLYLQLLHGGAQLVVALDKLTGQERWKAERPTDARHESRHAYASPQLYIDENYKYLLTHGADYIVAHDLDDGHEIWRSGGLQLPGRYSEYLRFVVSPVVVPGSIIVPSAKNSVLRVINPGGTGDITDDPKFQRWTCNQTPDVPCPLVHDGLVYLNGDKGTLTCLDLRTGEEYYEKRIHAHRHRASPMLADGKLYLTARDGHITVIKPGKKFEVLAENEMGEQIASSPIVSGGRIYIRSFTTLWAIEAK